MKKYLLPQSGSFYKANLHSHSTLSDGKMTPEEMKQKYMENGYSSTVKKYGPMRILPMRYYKIQYCRPL